MTEPSTNQAPDLILVTNAGPGPIVVAGSYLEPGETRRISAAALALFAASHPHPEWLLETPTVSKPDDAPTVGTPYTASAPDAAPQLTDAAPDAERPERPKGRRA
jgi:hypothetical protein